MIFLAKHIGLYRPKFVERFERCSNGYWVPCYGLEPLRAKLFGIRVPVEWAFDLMLRAGLVK